MTGPADINDAIVVLSGDRIVECMTFDGQVKVGDGDGESSSDPAG